MNDRLFALRLFVRVAHTGSFSRAAREERISQPTASRTIASLEREIGATLFSRTTRAVTLTEAGGDYLARVRAILDALEEADYAARGTGELRGVLRVSASSLFASRAVIPRLPPFSDRHPALRIEIIVDDRRQDLIHEGADMALRFGPLADSTAFARKLGTWPRMMVASPAYLARMGTPESPGDLADHRAILFGSNSRSGLTFSKDGREMSVRMDGRIMATASDAAITAAVAGLGIFSALRPALIREVERGELVQILPDWDMGSTDVHVLFPSGQAAKPSARAFTDYLVSALHDL